MEQSISREWATEAGRHQGHLNFMADYFDDLFHEEEWIRQATIKTFKSILEEYKRETTD